MTPVALSVTSVSIELVITKLIFMATNSIEFYILAEKSQQNFSQEYDETAVENFDSD